ncbi:MAG: hypothetical protein ACKE51_00695 [Methylococcaceae bacterium]
MSHQNKQTIKNRRKSTRLIRADIKASISRRNFLGVRDTFNCKLLDICSAGVQVLTPTNIGVNAKLQLNLQFGNEKEFTLNAKIIHHQESVHFLSTLNFPALQYFLNNKAAPLKSIHLFESNQELKIKFRNLTTSSVKVLSNVAINLNEHHSILFTLYNEEQQKTSCKINKHQKIINYSYGIKFDKPNDALGDCILETQTDLIFK